MTKEEFLAISLPFGLKMYINSQFGDFIAILAYSNFSNDLRNGITIEGCINLSAKPILRPLSDLTKEITHKGKTFYPLEIIGKIIDNEYTFLSEDEDGIIVGKDVYTGCACPYECDGQVYSYNLFYEDFNFYSNIFKDGNEDDLIGVVTHESYFLIQKLIEWHFAIGLDKNDYINVNTLDKNPYE